MSTLTINLEALVYKAYKMGFNSDRDSEMLSLEDVVSWVFAKVPLVSASVAGASSAAQVARAPEKASAKQSSRKAEGDKPKVTRTRTVPDDEFRCMAKKNTGERCAIKRHGESEFCHWHENKQPHGVWEGEGDDLEDKPAPKKIIRKPAPVSNKPKSAPAVSKASAKTAAANSKNANSKIDVGENEDYVPVENKGLDMIDIFDKDLGAELSYLINKKGEVFDVETEKKYGVYDKKTKKWLSGGPMVFEDLSDHEEKEEHLDALLEPFGAKKKSKSLSIDDLEDDDK
jgi:hypothetical protein